MRRVVITGMGVIASTGKNVTTFVDNLALGHSGVRRITLWDPSALSVQIAAEVPDYQPTDYFPLKRLDLMDRFTQFAVIAAREAMESSQINISEEELPRFGVVTGTGMGGAQTLEQGYNDLYLKGLDRVRPLSVPMLMHNAAAAQIGIELGVRGPVLTYSTACASSAKAKWLRW